MPLIFNVLVSLLVNVIVCGELVVPTVCVPKALGVDSVIGKIVVPVKLTTCGLTAVLTLIATAPSIVPRIDGLNVTEKLQFAPAASVRTHGLLGVRE
jgi:hypothetical protein